QIFSRSILWDLQRRYFADKGIEAWRSSEVPHYITNNTTVANSYAEIIFGFLRDQNRLAPSDDLLTICELGAGSGRLAFHLLGRLRPLLESASLPPTSIRYVLTDAVALNLDFWRQHNSFQQYFADQTLDIALLDASQTDRLALRVSGQTITPGQLRRPIIVVANYLFDTIPQEMFYAHAGKCEQCLVTLSLDKDPAGLDATELLAE